MSEIELNKICREIFGISPRHYRRLAQEGYVPNSVRGRIPLLEAVRALCVYYRERAEKKEETFEHEKVLKLGVERKIKEFQLAIRSGDLIPKSDISRMFLEREKAVKKGLSSLHRSLVRKLLGKDARKMGEVIKVAVSAFLDKMSRMR